MITLLVFILILSLLILVHEFGHFWAARRAGVRVQEFSLGFGPQLFVKQIKDTKYSISLIPLGGYVKMAGDTLAEAQGKSDEYLSKSTGVRFGIIFCGPFLNYVLGFLFFWLILFVGYPTLTTKVGGLLDGYGAKAAGIAIADKIIAINHQPVGTWGDLQREIKRNKQQETVAISLIRNNQQMEFMVPLQSKVVASQLGPAQALGIIGITPFDEIVEVRHGFIKSAFLGARDTLDLTYLTYQGIWQLVSGKKSMRESMTGPLGIFLITSKAAKLGIIALMHLVAVLSISLAIFNLLPLPILDGGHIFLLGLEKLRKKALSLKAERVMNNAGVCLLMGLIVFVTYNDILRLYGDKISKLFGK